MIRTILTLVSLVPSAFLVAKPVPVVDLDLDRYLGLWYEIARIPAEDDPQEFCINATAYYEALEDGTIGVENSCEARLLGVKLRQRIFGIAQPLSDEEAIFKLELRPLSGLIPVGNKYRRGFKVEGDYWVLEIGEDYEYALVGNPTRTNLFILSRTPKLNPESFNMLVDLAVEKHGYGDSIDDLILSRDE